MVASIGGSRAQCAPLAFCMLLAASALAGCARDPEQDPAGAPTAPATANQPPTISGAPADVEVEAGQTYKYVPNASDPDGDPLTFSVDTLPKWATFDAKTGTVSGTPTDADVATASSFTVSVSDGTTTTRGSTQGVKVKPRGTKAPTNQAPTLSGTPTTSVAAGKPYSFTPTASDPEGAKLTFSIANKPAWASFDPATGALTGTPSSTDVGTFANVSVAVSDGALSATLAPFTITVQGAVLGSATLSWTPPTTRADGSALTNLAGYRVHYGTVRGSYANHVTIATAGVTQYVVENLPSGTYYFALTAYDGAGAESGYSSEASKTIQ